MVIICKHVSIDIYNQRKNYTESELDEGIASDDKNVVDIVISSESIDRLSKIICELNPIYQEAIFLRFFHDFSVIEIADMKNISTKTVQKRIERAKKQLLKLLRKEGELNV